MRLRLRVDDLNPEMGSRFLEMLKKHLPTDYVVVRHVLPGGRNPHYHAYVNCPMMMHVSGMRYWVDKLGVKGPDRSVKECDEERVDEYIQYLFNRKHGNVWYLIESTIDTTAHQAAAAQVADEFQERQRAKSSRKTTEPTTWDLAEQVRSSLSVDNREPLSEAQLYEWATDYAIDACRRARKTYTDFSIQRIVQTAVTASKETRQLFTQRVVARMISH